MFFEAFFDRIITISASALSINAPDDADDTEDEANDSVEGLDIPKRDLEEQDDGEMEERGEHRDDLF